MVFFDFIEIGTSNFSTEIERASDDIRGLSVEPIRKYLDDLPNKKNCIKFNAAISNYRGLAKIYYISEENIETYHLNKVFIGCNSLNNPHPTVKNYLHSHNLNPEELITSETIEVYQFKDLVEQFDISGCYYLKIDTEGHDTIILNDYLEYCRHYPYLLAHVIMFETNCLSSKNDIDQVINQLFDFGYEMISQDENTRLVLNINKMGKKSDLWNGPIENYYITDYPENYDPNNLPHENNLESAKQWCHNHNHNGVTYQNQRYEVRRGPYLKRSPTTSHENSWIRLPF
jgi:hypothetical protein